MRFAASLRLNKCQALLCLICCGLLAPLPSVAQSWGQYRELGCQSLQEGNYRAARRSWSAAFDICRQDSPPGDRYYLTAGGLAESLWHDGKTEEAEALFKQLVEARVSGNSSDAVNAGVRAYQQMLRSLGREAEAEELQVQLSPSPSGGEMKREAAVSSPPAWQQLIAQGDTEWQSKKIEAARSSFKAALQIAVEQRCDAQIAATLGRLIKICCATGNYQQAEKYYARALPIVAKQRGAGSIDYLNGLTGYARLLRVLNRKHEAMAVEAKAERAAMALGLIQPAAGCGGGGGGGGSAGINLGCFASASSGQTYSASLGEIFERFGPDAAARGRRYGAVMRQMRNSE